MKATLAIQEAVVPKINHLGFQSQFKSLVTEPLEALRSGNVGDAIPGHEVSLKDFVEARFTRQVEKNGAVVKGDPITFDEFLADLGVNLNRMTIENLMTAPYDTRWLVPEIIRDAIVKGMGMAPIHTRLVRQVEEIAQPSIVMPYIDFADESKLEDTDEAETIGVGEITYGSKTVTVAKKAKGLSWTYESLRYTKMSLVAIYFEMLGVRFGYSLDAMLISNIINGDQADLSEAAPVVGVTDPAKHLTYADLVRVWVRGGLLARMYDQMIANEAETNLIMNLDEYKNRQAGTTLPLKVEVPIPQVPTLYPHISVPDDQVILLDKRYGHVQLVAAPMMVESEKIISRQIEQSFASITTGFTKLFRDSSIIIDEGETFAGDYDFPSWQVVGFED